MVAWMFMARSDNLSDKSYGRLSDGPGWQRLSRRPLANRRRSVAVTIGLCWFAILYAIAPRHVVAQTPTTWATPSALSPVYWREKIFLIPYRVNPRSGMGGRLARVELLLSRDGVTGWQSLGQAEPHLQGFRYFASADGDYWFALNTLDRKGKPLQPGPVQALLHMIVDTRQPVLSLAGAFDAEGAVVLRYDATDANLKPDSLVVEAQTDGQTWSPVLLARPDVNQPDRLMGRARLSLPVAASGVNEVKFRVAVTDRAGNRTDAVANVPLDGPQLNAPNTRLDSLPLRPIGQSPATGAFTRQPLADPFQQAPFQHGPNRTHSPSQQPSLVGTPNAGTPPFRNPYFNQPAAGQPSGERHAIDWPTPPTPARTPAQLVTNHPVDSSPANLSANPIGAPPLLSNAGPHAASSPTMQGWTAKSPQPIGGAGAATEPAMRMVGARTFDIQYDINSVGPWGVAKVELWGTHNGGQTWESYGVDPDNRSPMRVSVPAAGTYGFRILVDGANGTRSQPPRAGDPPELAVHVDLQPPTAQLHSVEHGRGNLVDHLIIRWTAADSNLELRPISLLFSTYQGGPWSTIAAGLENTGQYVWRIERYVPTRFYLRLEVRDTAGNLTVTHSPMPVVLQRTQPTGHLRGVRPVASEPSSISPSRFLTATGTDSDRKSPISASKVQ